MAATIAVVATLAASGAAVAVNLGASEPPLDPAAGQLTPAAATSAERVTTDPQATLVPHGTAADTRGDCDGDDCTDADDHTERDDDRDDDHRDDHDDDHDDDHRGDDHHDGADDDD